MRLAGRRAGWWVGWLYLGALLALLPSYAIVMPAVINPLFGWEGSKTEIIVIAVGVIVLSTALNLMGIELLGRLSAVGVAIELGILVVLSLLVFILGPHHGPGFLFETGGTGDTFGDWLPGFIGGGMFVGLWALFTFETAGTLGEETLDARREAPRAILGSWLVTVLGGICFIALFLLSIPDLPAAMKSGTPVQDIIGNVLPTWVVKLYLVLIVWVLILAPNALFTGISRHVYSMARDGQLPFSAALSRTRSNGVPWVAALTICVLSSLPVIFVTSDLTVLVTGAIAAIYVPYVLVMAISLWARVKGWPHGEPAPFSLGRWGYPGEHARACSVPGRRCSTSCGGATRRTRVEARHPRHLLARRDPAVDRARLLPVASAPEAGRRGGAARPGRGAGRLTCSSTAGRSFDRSAARCATSRRRPRPRRGPPRISRRRPSSPSWRGSAGCGWITCTRSRG